MTRRRFARATLTCLLAVLMAGALLPLTARPAGAAVPLIYRLAGIDGASKVISVISDGPGTHTARFTMWQRAGAAWTQVAGPWTATTGYGGWSYAPGESVATSCNVRGAAPGASPIGTFTFGTGFGSAGNPGYSLGWLDLRQATWFWNETPGTPGYNTPSTSLQPCETHYENLNAQPLYQYAAAINFNTSPVVSGAGSGIFLHIASSGMGPTAGCVGLQLPQLLQALRWIDAGTRIVMGPLDAVTRAPATPIEAKAWSSPVWLGNAQTAELATPTRPGSFQVWDAGSIYWSAATGAAFVGGAIRDAWAATGWENGSLGFPLADASSVGGALFQPFEHGGLYETGPTVTELQGSVYDRYLLAGGPGGPLGAPRSASTAGATFDNGTITVDQSTRLATIATSSNVDQPLGPVSVAGWASDLYPALLGRPADAGGAAWVASATYLGLPIGGIAGRIATSPEARSRQINSLYETAFGRAADAGGVASWTTALAKNSWAWVEASVYSSDEWYAAHGGTPAGYAAALYPALLNRSPDAAGLAWWTAQLESGTPRWVIAASFLGTDEVAQAAAARVFRQVLGRSADPVGIELFAAQLRAAGLDEAGLAATLASSPEFIDTGGHP